MGYAISVDDSRLDNFRSYHALRRQDWNRCGQAAVASLLDYHAAGPFKREEPVRGVACARRCLDTGEAIDLITKSFPPDHFFGLFGTTAARIVAALQSYGLEANAVRSRSTADEESIWPAIEQSVAEGLPVIVLLDLGKLGGRPFSAHWAVVYRVEDSLVHLANCRRTPVVPKDLFLRAFRCRLMLDGFCYCAVFTRPGTDVW